MRLLLPMPSKSRSPYTADILTPEQIVEHRVVFFSGTPYSVRLQTDGEVSVQRERMLSALLGCKVSLRKVPETPTTKMQHENRDAFYHVLHSCTAFASRPPGLNQGVLSGLVRTERAVFHEMFSDGTAIFLTDDSPDDLKKIQRMQRLLGCPVHLVFVGGEDSPWFDAYHAIIDATEPDADDDTVALLAPEPAEEAPAPRRLPMRRAGRKKRTAG